MKKTALILGGGGFIGGHLAKRLKEEGYWVRIVDIKPKHEFWNHKDICNDYVSGDLRNKQIVSAAFRLEKHPKVDDVPYEYSLLKQPFTVVDSFDEVYQLAADMGGAGYIFTGENDANVMHNSAMINLNTVLEASHTGVGRIFYSSSACMYPEHNQLDPNNPNCEESSAYPADPDSEYGWEKLFSERLFEAFSRNYNLDIRVARFHNIFGPQGTYTGGKEKAPAAMCRKAAEVGLDESIEVWGDGQQTRSFLYIDDCIEAILRFMRQDSFKGPVNIGSEEKVTINELAKLALKVADKDKRSYIKNIEGQEFIDKYGFECPIGVRGRNSDNTLYKEKMGWVPIQALSVGIAKTFEWINKQVN
jgi:nucleoside-diphosphate-sugar epimerase|tara:strand:- start:6967 stop:8049 length:1083 start_codon:yes stop_codon:yes gene_type:complete